MSIKSFSDFRKELTFTFNHKDKVTGQECNGEFTISRPNIATQIEIQKETARIKGDVGKLDDNSEMSIYMVSFIRGIVVKAPEWYYNSNQLDNLYDFNIVFELFNKFQEQLQAQMVSLAEPAPAPVATEPTVK